MPEVTTRAESLVVAIDDAGPGRDDVERVVRLVRPVSL